MCMADSSTNIDLDTGDLNACQYKCLDCDTKFKAIGKKVNCPSCESTNIKSV